MRNQRENVLRYFWILNSSMGTNSGVHQNACHLCCLSYIVLALSSLVTDLSSTALIFHDYQGPTIKFHDFPGLENEMLKFHVFPSCP